MNVTADIRQVSTRGRWLVVTLIFLTYLLLFLDRVNIAIAGRSIMGEFNLSSLQMGWIFSSYVLGYAALQVPGGWLCDRFGATRVLTASIILWSAFTTLTAVAGNLPIVSVIGVVGAFSVARALVGIGEAAGPPSASRLIADCLRPNERGLALGLSISGITAGGAIAPPFILWTVETWGWRAVFYIAGAMGVLLAAAWWLVVARASGSRSTSAPCTRPTPGRAPLTPRLVSKRSVPWKRLFGRRDLWCLTLAHFAFGYILYIYFTWFYLYLVEVRHVRPDTAGFYTVIPFVVSTVAAPIGGWVTDSLSSRFGVRQGRCAPGVASLTFSAVLIVVGASAKTAAGATALLSLAAGTLYLSISAYWAAAIDLSRAYAGTASGFMYMGANLGGALSPTLTPLIARIYGWSSALYFAAAVGLLGAIFWFGVHPERPLCPDLLDTPAGSSGVGDCRLE